jgi:hypothetical protein
MNNDEDEDKNLALPGGRNARRFKQMQDKKQLVLMTQASKRTAAVRQQAGQSRAVTAADLFTGASARRDWDTAAEAHLRQTEITAKVEERCRIAQLNSHASDAWVQDDTETFLKLSWEAVAGGSMDAVFNLSTYAQHNGRQALCVERMIQAANGGHADACVELAQTYKLGMLGVPRDHKESVAWLVKAAAAGDRTSCKTLAMHLYLDYPHARDTGIVDDASASDVESESSTVPDVVYSSVIYWCEKAGFQGTRLASLISKFRHQKMYGAEFCSNQGCKSKGHLQAFKVCSKCRHIRYCCERCQAEDWFAGHKFDCMGVGGLVDQRDDDDIAL